MNSEKMTIIEFFGYHRILKDGYHRILLMLNISLSDKYEPKPDDIAPSVEVSHYDCSEMTENNLYSLNQVKPCNMASQNIQMNDVKLTIIYKTLSNRNQCYNLPNQTPKKQILLPNEQSY